MNYKPSTIKDIFQPPENGKIKIWRYMGLGKFYSLLETQSLYFTRADKLGDKFEGSIPKANKDLIEKIEDSKMKEVILKIQKDMLKKMFINCWHMNEEESFLMWKVYGSEAGAVCVQSTHDKLISATQNYKKYTIDTGCVTYLNYDTDTMPRDNIFWPFMHKTIFFKEENELRSIIHSSEIEQSGIEVPIKLEDLIENIYVNPSDGHGMYGIVQTLIEKSNLSGKIRPIQSSLA